MTGDKYKIEQNGQFLGHWCATSPAGAIKKMSKSMYADIYKPNFNDYFNITRGNHSTKIYIGEV